MPCPCLKALVTTPPVRPSAAPALACRAHASPCPTTQPPLVQISSTAYQHMPPSRNTPASPCIRQVLQRGRLWRPAGRRRRAPPRWQPVRRATAPATAASHATATGHAAAASHGTAKTHAAAASQAVAGSQAPGSSSIPSGCSALGPHELGRAAGAAAGAAWQPCVEAVDAHGACAAWQELARS